MIVSYFAGYIDQYVTLDIDPHAISLPPGTITGAFLGTDSSLNIVVDTKAEHAQTPSIIAIVGARSGAMLPFADLVFPLFQDSAHTAYLMIVK